MKAARNMLWRRERNRVGTGKRYMPTIYPTENTVHVDEFRDLEGVDIAISTRIGSNIDGLSPRRLAELAIASAREDPETEGRDGISYLMSVKRNGISTPIMAGYEEEILSITGALSLVDALARCREE